MGEIELGAAAEATIHAYRELAIAPAKRLALSNDQTCIQFLAYVIAEGEGTLVKSAVDTLSLLAETPECRPHLAGTFGVLESLQAIADSEDNKKYSEGLKNQATALFTCLQFSRHIGKLSASQNAASTSKSTTNTERPISEQSNYSTSSNRSTTPGLSERTPTPPDKDLVDSVDFDPKSIDSDTSRSTNVSSLRKNCVSTSSNSGKAKTVTLFIKGMVGLDQRKLVEEKLVRVRGLISIVFDLARSRVTCRVKRDLSVEKLAAAIEKTEVMKALQVITTAEGQEEMVIIGDTPNPWLSTTSTSPIEDLPDYLSEEECEVDSKTAMAPSGSLREAASSIFSTAASILQKSFYW